MQQVRDWKSWLTRHRGHVTRFFPSKYFGRDEFSNLSFCVVIGRRSPENSQTAKRNVLARETAIKIRSFDYLTDVLRARFNFLSDWAHYDEPTAVRRGTPNQLANPFARAYSWRDWRQVVDRPHFRFSHFVEHNAESLLAHRTYSKEYDSFLRWWRSLPARRRARYTSQALSEDSWDKMFVEFGDERHTPP